MVDVASELGKRVVRRMDEGRREAARSAVGEDEEVARTSLDAAAALHVRRDERRRARGAGVHGEHGEIELRACVTGDSLVLRDLEGDGARRVDHATWNGTAVRGRGEWFA